MSQIVPDSSVGKTAVDALCRKTIFFVLSSNGVFRISGKIIFRKIEGWPLFPPYTGCAIKASEERNSFTRLQINSNDTSG